MRRHEPHVPGDDGWRQSVTATFDVGRLTLTSSCRSRDGHGNRLRTDRCTVDCRTFRQDTVTRRRDRDPLDVHGDLERRLLTGHGHVRLTMNANQSVTATICAMKKAFITGVNGQDGSYLAELLLSKGYEVHGLIRRSSSFNTQRVEQIYHDPHESGVRFLMHYGDLSDSGSLINLIRDLEPDEIYHLGAQSHVKVSFDVPEYTADATAMGTIRMLEAIRASGVETRFYQASSSEMFGSAPPPQSELTPFHPRSPYGVSKVFAYWATVNYREAYGLFACNGILFNHESIRRGETFVTRKITRAVARIKAGHAGQAVSGQPGRRAGLGARARIRRGDVADAATGRARRLRDRERRVPHGPGVRGAGLRAGRARLATARRDRPAVLPPGGGRLAVRRSSKARETLGWTGADQLRGARRADGRRRHPPAWKTSWREARARRPDD